MKSVNSISKNKIFIVICIALLAAVLFTFVCTGRDYGNQAMNAFYLSAQFEGEYKIADGDWQPYVKGGHIPADKGDVTLKGHFVLCVPDTGEIVGNAEEGVTLAFYFNHLAGEISENGEDFRPFDAELDVANEDMCGKMYIGYQCKNTDEVIIRLKNPHKFGNAGAVDDFFDNLNTYGGTDFERDTLNRGSSERVLGIVLILFAFMILGTAIFSALIHVKGNGNLWLVGFGIFFSGIYFMFKAHGVMFFSEIIKFNTRMLVGSMMLYMLTITAIIAFWLDGKGRKLGISLTVLDLASICAFMLAPQVADVRFYDTLPVWAVLQSAICLVLTILLALRFRSGNKNEKMLSILAALPLVAFVADSCGESFGLWQGGIISEIVFIFMFVISLILLLKVVPQNLNAAIRARELEVEKKILSAELAESRIATMISQIQPHFIYNTLGTIEQLCITEPEAASKLVRNFSLYLRGNFSELDNAKPIRFSQEMNHVKHYTDIEQVRFPDITIQYDLRSVEFLLPALSVQPLVENAIKHGLMGLDEGGIVTISAYETDDYYMVEVTDDGVGFDMSAGYDET
ncbi:MAG: histidine kinase, partial [Clostridia bacterium]|nr:histidine kinase [Clostridia bacterium]